MGQGGTEWDSRGFMTIRGFPISLNCHEQVDITLLFVQVWQPVYVSCHKHSEILRFEINIVKSR